MSERQLKLVFLGDCNVGKSSIIKRFLTEQFDEEYQPTNSIGELTSSIKVNSNIVKLVIWDISGKGINMTPEFAAKVFPSFDVYYIVFSCDNKESYENAKTHWMELVEPHMKEDSLLIYIASKADMWDEEEEEGSDYLVSCDDIEDLDALECSAMENEGVRAVFHTALRWALQRWDASGMDQFTSTRELLRDEEGLLKILQDPQQINFFRSLLRQDDKDAVEFLDNNINELIDIIVSDDFPAQYSNSICDIFTNQVKLLEKLVRDDILERIFQGLGTVQEPRKANYLLRLLNFLFVNHREAIVNYIQEHKVLSLLLENLNETTIEFISNMFEIIKQQKLKYPHLEINVLNSEEVVPILIKKMGDEDSLSSIIQLLSGILSVGEVQFIKDVLIIHDSSFLKATFDILKDKTSDRLGNAATLFTDFIFPIIRDRDDEEFIQSIKSVVTLYETRLLELIEDDSILIVFYGAQLTNGLATCGIVSVELMTSLCKIFYKYPRSSTLHLLIAESIISVVEKDTELSRALLEDQSIFIAELCAKCKEGSGTDYYPHLVNIIKILHEQEYATAILNDCEVWNELITESWESMNHVPGTEMYTPAKSILEEKERQMAGPRGRH